MKQFSSHLSSLIVVILLCPVAKAQQTMGRWTLGATVPFGKIQVCPTSESGQRMGIDIDNSTFSGFCVGGLTEADVQGRGEYVTLMPDKSGKNVHLLKQTEQAEPGYYSIGLSNGTWLTATATACMTAERFSFPDVSKAVLLVSRKSDFEQKTLTMGQGMAECAEGNGGGRRLLHYRLYASTPFVQNITADGHKRLTFPELTGRWVEVRIVVADSANELEAMTEEEVWQTGLPSMIENAKSQWDEVLAGRGE